MTYVAEDRLPDGIGTLQAERAQWASDFGGTLSSEGFEGLSGAPASVIDFGDFTLSFSGKRDLTLFGANEFTRTEGAQSLGFTKKGTITLTFDEEITALGIDWSSFDKKGTRVRYKDNAGNFIKDVFDPVTRAGAGFFGIIDPEGFTEVTFLVKQSETLEFDFIQYGRSVAPVPLPAGLPLLVGALGVLGLVRRRQR